VGRDDPPADARAAIEDALGTREGWSIEADPDEKDRQTILFNYPSSSGYSLDYGNSYGVRTGYVQPRIKLEFGARGDPEPFEQRDILPYVAEDFPGEVPDAVTAVPTLALERTYWEKATIPHALHHSGKLRPGLSRHSTMCSCSTLPGLPSGRSPNAYCWSRLSGTKVCSSLMPRPPTERRSRHTAALGH
jgi:hypothetical protein